MIIDFDKIESKDIEGFKGGKGLLHTCNFEDENNKIMLSCLEPGASSGFHCHEKNSEVIFIIKGDAKFRYDDTEEILHTGQVHYCPMGHSHCFENIGDDQLVYFAQVAEHKK